jgi:hypothetical protein
MSLQLHIRVADIAEVQAKARTAGKVPLPHEQRYAGEQINFLCETPRSARLKTLWEVNWNSRTPAVTRYAFSC